MTASTWELTRADRYAAAHQERYGIPLSPAALWRLTGTPPPPGASDQSPPKPAQEHR